MQTAWVVNKLGFDIYVCIDEQRASSQVLIHIFKDRPSTEPPGKIVLSDTLKTNTYIHMNIPDLWKINLKSEFNCEIVVSQARDGKTVIRIQESDPKQLN